MTSDEDTSTDPRGRPPAGAAGRWAERTRRRLRGSGAEQRFHTKHFLLGLTYGFALGFVLEVILASHP